MKIILAGPKSSGKSSVGKLLAERLNTPVFETDTLLEEIYKKETGTSLSCRQICRKIGEIPFRNLEKRAVQDAADRDWCIVCVGGSTFMDPESRRLLRRDAILILLTADPEILWNRILQGGMPSYLEKESDPKAAYLSRMQNNLDAVSPYADFSVETTDASLEEVTSQVVEGIVDEISLRSCSASSFGEILRVTTFGESHGRAVGAVLDGIPANIPLEAEDIQRELDRRRPGQSAVSTPRKEADLVKILSGVFEGKTTGTPICFLVENKDQDSTKYENLRNVFRPGHADFTFWKKYGIRDHRGGGRSSGRETIGRVAAGALAKKILQSRGVRITAYAQEISGIPIEKKDLNIIESNSVRCPDVDAAKRMESAILEARKQGDSVGGIVQLEIEGIPAGLGDPVFGKLDAKLGAAMFSLGAVKGVEIGTGFRAAKMRGSESNDPMRDNSFVTDNAGGILGGISNGQPILMRIAVKPTPSISKPQQTCNLEGENVEITIQGRHDPCIVPRIIPVVESMAALVLLDLWEMQSRLRPEWNCTNP